MQLPGMYKHLPQFHVMLSFSSCNVRLPQIIAYIMVNVFVQMQRSAQVCYSGNYILVIKLVISIMKLCNTELHLGI